MPSPLSVTMQQQEQCNWCWAAVAASLSSAMPPGNPAPMSQCQIASSLLCSADPNCCCDDGHVRGGCPDSPCNKPELIENALDKIGHYGGSLGELPDQATVTRSINDRHPIVGEIHWNDDQSQNHYVLIVDYGTDSSGEFVVWIADPSDPDGTVPQSYSLDALKAGGYRDAGPWIGSYFTA